MDLTGQVAADALPQNHFSGVTGMVDFVIGANRAADGKSIIVIPSRQRDGKASRIVPELDGGSVVVSGSNVHHVVSEFGAVNLFGKNLQERAIAMISISHPESRDVLLEEAKKRGIVGPERTLSESLYGVYPVHLEEAREYEGVRVTFRPVKITDIRRIQEHFYAMEEQDIQSRFFSQRKSFYEDHMQSRSQIDYIRSMTIVAVTGRETYEKIIGIGEYVQEEGRDIAEVAFSVLKEWQGKGIARILIQKIAEAAVRNGLAGLVAYTSLKNRAMVKVFKTLPYAVETVFDGDFFILTCRFNRQK
jgi:GNAT superfamily N-acetyltransferase